MYRGYGIASDGKGKWNFCNYYAKNVVIFGVDNSSSSHVDNRKNNFIVLGEEDTFRITESFGTPGKKFSINFIKARAKFCLSLYCNGDNSYLFPNGK